MFRENWDPLGIENNWRELFGDVLIGDFHNCLNHLGGIQGHIPTQPTPTGKNSTLSIQPTTMTNKDLWEELESKSLPKKIYKLQQ
jgi:hypothetical protein